MNASNHSIDRVVFQIERLSGQINDLVLSAKEHVDGMISHGEHALADVTKYFSNTKEGVEKMVDVLNSKTNGFPVDALYTALIMTLIVLVALLLYLLSSGSYGITNRYYRTKNVELSGI